MQIVIVGGIFGKPGSYRASVGVTPETVLAAGLRSLGHDVVERGHHGPFDFDTADVVHVHHLSYGAVVAATGRTPFVFTSHWLRHSSLLRRTAVRYVMSRADASVVLSETERRWQERAFPTGGSRYVIPNGIDSTIFRFAAPPAARPPWRLLFVGQLARFKGLDYLFRALTSVRGIVPVRLQLAYQIRDEETHLRALADELGIEVEFLGPCTPTDLARLYAENHALVLPSTGEALPSVISEAMFVGRPVIGTDVGAVREQVGGFGYVVRPRQPSEIAAAITALSADYDRFADVARDVSRTAIAKYSVETMVAAHVRMYAAVVGADQGSKKAGLAGIVRRASVTGAQLSRRRQG